jgi:ABC-type branched-subunit amino acid transport system ATPase component
MSLQNVHFSVLKMIGVQRNGYGAIVRVLGENGVGVTSNSMATIAVPKRGNKLAPRKSGSC